MSDSLINQFKQITGADDSAAKFYLDSCNNDLQKAVSQFLDGGGDMPDSNEPLPVQVPQKPLGNVGRKLGTGTSSEPVYAPVPSVPASKPKDKKPAQKSKFASLTDFQGNDNEDDDESNRYYAGGGKNSGQQIIGASNKSKLPDDDLAAKLFKAAMERGGKPTDGDDDEKPKPKPQSKFTGQGVRLGSTADVQQPSTPQQPKPTLVPPTKSNVPQPPEERVLTLTFYTDGFTIDDSPLLSLEDPKNKQLLESMHQGYVPLEYSKGAKKCLVNLIQKNEKYTPPPKVFKAFEGGGKALGTATTSAVPTPTATTTTASLSTSKSVPKYSCDLTKPHTTLQIRLHDGTRLVAKFNLTDTLQTVADFVAASSSKSVNFSLMCTFPKKELTDMTQTIDAAKLQNAALVQHLK